METIPSSSGTSTSGVDAPDPQHLAGLAPQLLASDDETARRRLGHLLAIYDHDALLACLKDASEEYRSTDAQASLRLAELLIAAAERAGRPDHRALGLMARGDAVRALGRFGEAAATLDEAGAAFLAQGDRVGWARTRIGWLVAAHYLGDGAAALQIIDAAREALQTGGMVLRVGILELNGGWVCWKLGRQQQALAHYERARHLFATLGAAAEVQLAWTKANTAIVLTELGDFPAALQLHEEVRQIWERRGERLLVAQQEQNIAYVYAGQGYYTRALRSFSAAFATQQQAGFPIEAAWTSLNIVDCYLRLNLLDRAITVATETTAIFERSGTVVGVARARLFCALAHARGGDRVRASDLLEQATATFAAAQLLDELAFSQLARSYLSAFDGDWTTARETAAAASASFAERGLVGRHAQADLARATAVLELGDAASASLLAEGALTIAREYGISWLLPDGYAVLGGVARTRGKLTEALAHFDRAIVSIEDLQRVLAIDLRTNYLADKRQHYDAALSLCLQLGQTARAFSYLERAKSRALVDYLANNLEIQIKARAGAAPQLVATLASLRAEHTWIAKQLYDDHLTGTTTTRPAADTLRDALHERERQIGQVIEQLALDRTEGLSLTRTADPIYLLPPTDLEPGTVLVEYSFSATGNLAFVITQGQLHAISLPTSEATLGRLLRNWQLNLAASANAILSGASVLPLARNGRAILGALHRELFAPLDPLLDSCDRLIVIPHGVTHAIPFNALHDGTHYLIERYEVATCPSSSLLRLCRERARRTGRMAEPTTALVMAHSAGGQLPFVEQEARMIAALLPGELLVEEAASRQALTAAASRHPIVHLATHGEARLDDPNFAHLLLADGPLGMVDVFNLDLRGALVVLSACESGRVVVHGGDELVGLSRSFLYAGASTLIQSLWRVEDGSTAQLMGYFYRALRDGATKGAALRAAQLALLRGTTPYPYYWASFQLVGDSDAL